MTARPVPAGVVGHDEPLLVTPQIQVQARPHWGTYNRHLPTPAGRLEREELLAAPPPDPGDGGTTPAPTTGLLWPRV